MRQGVDKREAVGMQEVGKDMGSIGSRAIDKVAYNRVSDMAQVDPDLVGAPCLGYTVEKRIGGGRSERAPGRV
jgi:hypothetical protein